MITGLANVLDRNCCLSEHQDFKFFGEECPDPSGCSRLLRLCESTVIKENPDFIY